MNSVASRVAIPLILLWFTATGPALALPVWVEAGDAGDRFSPQVTAGVGDLTQIVGTIGDPDLLDAFEFGYGGAPGPLTITAAFDDPLTPPVILGVTLVDGAGNSLADGAGTLSHNNLAAGLYIVEVVLAHGNDPPYTIEFLGPAGGPEGVVYARSVPEPSTLALMAAAFVLLAMRRGRHVLTRGCGPRTVAHGGVSYGEADRGQC